MVPTQVTEQVEKLQCAIVKGDPVQSARQQREGLRLLASDAGVAQTKVDAARILEAHEKKMAGEWHPQRILARRLMGKKGREPQV